MDEKRLKQAVVEFRPPAHRLLETIRLLAANLDNIKPSLHALERMDERGITFEDAAGVLRRGSIVGDVVAGANPGEWKCKVVERRRRARAIGVVTVVLTVRGVLLIKTVEWEDR